MSVKIEGEAAAFQGTKRFIQRSVEAGAEATYLFLRDYHSQMDWRGGHWMPGGNSGEFARRVVEGWQPPTIQGMTVTIVNNFGLLSWKVTGGEIRPKNARALIIPLIPAAKGVPARSMKGLFIVGKTLCREIGRQLEAVYALSAGVKQAPWPKALPEEDEVAKAFNKGVESVPPP